MRVQWGLQWVGLLSVLFFLLHHVDAQTQRLRTRTRISQQDAEEAQKTLKVKSAQLDTSRKAYEERESVLAEREYALDTRDADSDKTILDTDKRLKEREARLAAREAELGVREKEVLKKAEMREQEIERLGRERETASRMREKALVERENLVEAKERELNLQSPSPTRATPSRRFQRPQNQQFHQQRIIPRRQSTTPATPIQYQGEEQQPPQASRGRVRQRLVTSTN